MIDYKVMSRLHRAVLHKIARQYDVNPDRLGHTVVRRALERGTPLHIQLRLARQFLAAYAALTGR